MRNPSGANERLQYSPEIAEAQTGAPPAVRHDPRKRRWLVVAAWVAGGLALTAIFVRISLSARVMSDGGNNALQGWDLLHGHLLLAGWQIGDANYYFLELPLLALAEALFGLGDFAQHVGSALTYMLVTVVAMAVAMADSRGTARAVRSAVVLAVMAAPLFAGIVYLVLEEPDHIGTSVFILGSFLLIDRLPGRWFTAPLLLVILCAGQFEDLTVRYVAVPAILVVCVYRALAARSFRSPDIVLACTAAASLPLSNLYGRLWVHIGGFTTAATRAGLSPAHEWPHHIPVTLANILFLYGGNSVPNFVPGIAPGWKAYLGLACALAAAFGLAWVAWRWRRASRAEQMTAAALVCNVGAYVASGFAAQGNAHELAAVLPCGAVLAARALVPARIRGTRAAFASVTAVALLAALPLAYAASRPDFRSPKLPLAMWLEAHGLTYGVGVYDDGSSVTVLTHNRIRLRVIHVGAESLGPSNFEVKQRWYFPSRYDATFAVANPAWRLPPSKVVHLFGKPAATYQVDSWTILVYKKNLLRLLVH